MRIKMWGVRGSIPSPGPDTVEFGGNTSCYEVRCGDALIILDGGTGLRLLGQELLKEMPIEAWMFFSHVHWDHIQGFPFFTPAFVRGNTFHLRGGVNVSRTLEETLAGQMDYPSFPVHLSEMGATMTFRDLYEGESVMVGPKGNVKVTNARGNHPNGVYAYRVEYEGKVLVYVTDSEHYAIVDPKLKKLSMNADVLIFDAMYTPEEDAGEVGGGPKTGWGHATFVAGCELAKAANVKQLVLEYATERAGDVMAEGRDRELALAQFALLGEGQAREVRRAAHRVHVDAGELALVEGRARHHVVELGAQPRVVARGEIGRARALERRVPHRLHAALPRSVATQRARLARSAFAGTNSAVVTIPGGAATGASSGASAGPGRLASCQPSRLAW